MKYQRRKIRTYQDLYHKILNSPYPNTILQPGEVHVLTGEISNQISMNLSLECLEDSDEVLWTNFEANHEFKFKSKGDIQPSPLESDRNIYILKVIKRIHHNAFKVVVLDELYTHFTIDELAQFFKILKMRSYKTTVIISGTMSYTKGMALKSEVTSSLHFVNYNKDSRTCSIQISKATLPENNYDLHRRISI